MLPDVADDSRLDELKDMLSFYDALAASERDETPFGWSAICHVLLALTPATSGLRSDPA
jgi:hypothetical protein